ncbi:MAG: hypothetical protein IJ934_03355, partial [Acetobacter sp.]|nr:hypothetical protein [Acetobacter sp.]
VNDERNGPVIRANIAKAFCLVAYNAEETDRTKQKTLLNEVVNQVMALSYGNSKDEEQEEQKESHTKGSVSSLQRMLFLLNRVDAFYRHDDASKQLEKFKGEVTTQLRGKLEEALPNHKKTIKKATHDLAQICSLPALLAVEADLLWKAPEKQAEVLKRFDKEFGNIFPKDYFDEFPRKIKDIEQLKEEQKKDLIQKALECSYGEAFEKRLSSHITETFFEIVFDVPLRNLSETSGHLVQMLDTLVERYKARTEQEAQEAQLRLREIDDKLSNEIQKISEICRCVITITKDTSEKMEARLGGGKKTL